MLVFETRQGLSYRDFSRAKSSFFGLRKPFAGEWLWIWPAIGCRSHFWGWILDLGFDYDRLKFFMIAQRSLCSLRKIYDRSQFPPSKKSFLRFQASPRSSKRKLFAREKFLISLEGSHSRANGFGSGPISGVAPTFEVGFSTWSPVMLV